MKALTIQQPWAWAIAEGHKRVENRTWKTTYRGPLAIHAGSGRKWMQEGTEFIFDQGITVPDDLPFGAIVATVDLVDCLEYNPDQKNLDIDSAIALSADPFAFGPHCWLLENVRKLSQPIEIPGKLSLWNVPEAIEKQLLNQLASV